MTEIIKVDPENPDPGKLSRAADEIKAGGLVIYPTETVYGLAADATSDEAVRRVFEAKARSFESPISVAVDSPSMASEVGELTRRERVLIREFMPGPLTVVVKSRPDISTLLSADTGGVGIRIPDHPVALDLIGLVGGPITSTSANVSGGSAPVEVGDAIGQLGGSVDLAIDSGGSPFKRPSSVVEVLDEGIRVIREGPISKSDLLSAMR